MGGKPEGGPEQKLRPNQADRILKSYCENLNQKYFDKKIWSCTDLNVFGNKLKK